MNKLKGYYLMNCNSKELIEPEDSVIEEVIKAKYETLESTDTSLCELEDLYKNKLYTSEDSYYIGLLMIKEFMGSEKLLSKINMILNTVTVSYDKASKVVTSCSIMESLREDHSNHSRDY